MRGFDVLDAAHPAERERWLALWARWPAREVQAHPAYLALFAGPEDRVRAAVLEDEEGGGVLYAFLQRPVPRSPGAWDLTSPYGYGGPFAWGETIDARADAFWAAFDAWAGATGVVAEFIRYAVGGVRLLPGPQRRRHRQDNIVGDVRPTEDERWRAYAHKVRKNVNKARRAGLRVVVDEQGAHLDDFLRIYAGTMQRRDARPGYYFPRAFFEQLARELPGGFTYVHVLADERIVSTELALVSAQRMYSFLGGTDEAAFDLRPNDLLKHAMYGWAHERGLAEVVLGGGFTPGDGIFRYKQDFFPAGAVPFHTGERVLDEARYAALVDARSGPPPDPDFFPAYRAPGG